MLPIVVKETSSTICCLFDCNHQLLVVDSKPSNCSVKWSSWFNTHHPEPYMTSGDWETINHIEAKYGPICTKSTISDVQCVCAGSASDWTTTGDVMVRLSHSAKNNHLCDWLKIFCCSPDMQHRGGSGLQELTTIWGIHLRRLQNPIPLLR